LAAVTYTNVPIKTVTAVADVPSAALMTREAVYPCCGLKEQSLPPAFDSLRADTEECDESESGRADQD
jgi:hypothetical protein